MLTLLDQLGGAGHEQNSGPIDDILDFFEATTPGVDCPARRRRANAVHVSAMGVTGKD